mmetsp:Transcript_18462/g.24624  ORF Transcript_18462/g.24624 Transcript_18462/m.24624 type:complete len:265 (+) Transcript_18462:113-907(+)
MRVPLTLLTIAATLQQSNSLSLSNVSQQGTRRAALTTIQSAIASAVLLTPKTALANEEQPQPAVQPSSTPKFQRYPQLRFIAALGDPNASSGTGANTWGLWKDDPGPRGVYLRDYQERLVKRGGVAPAGWTFQNNDWWLEEHGLIMYNPEPLPSKKYSKSMGQILPYKRYVVTGDREVTTVLTVFEDGRWELQKGNLYDVTHLPCRSARYTPTADNNGSDGMCTPSKANGKDFPVKPGAVMPSVPDCNKQDYAVLFVLGEEVIA